MRAALGLAAAAAAVAAVTCILSLAAWQGFTAGMWLLGLAWGVRP